MNKKFNAELRLPEKYDPAALQKVFRDLQQVLTLSREWDGNHIKMGTYHLWIDDTGDLRVKNGVPTSHTDGTVVGTQS